MIRDFRTVSTIFSLCGYSEIGIILAESWAEFRNKVRISCKRQRKSR